MKVESSTRLLLWTSLFGVAFALVEASVVVYLRALYYPAGFEFPLRLITIDHLGVELAREAATILMLVAIGALAGRTKWDKFGFFLVAFGVWDIFYYVWLMVFVGWPAAMVDWDVLFLLPLRWIGPVIAPVLISLLMIYCGAVIVRRFAAGRSFAPGWKSWILAGLATAVLLVSFMIDTDATLHEAMPGPYRYELLGFGLLLYAISFFLACRNKPS